MVAKGLLVDAVALRRVAGMVKGALEAELARHRVGHAVSVLAVIAANVHNAEIVDQEFSSASSSAGWRGRPFAYPAARTFARPISTSHPSLDPPRIGRKAAGRALGTVWRISFPSGCEVLYILPHEGTTKVPIGVRVMQLFRRFSDKVGSVAVLWSFLRTDPDNTWGSQRKRSGHPHPV